MTLSEEIRAQRREDVKAIAVLANDRTLDDPLVVRTVDSAERVAERRAPMLKVAIGHGESTVFAPTMRHMFFFNPREDSQG